MLSTATLVSEHLASSCHLVSAWLTPLFGTSSRVASGFEDDFNTGHTAEVSPDYPTAMNSWSNSCCELTELPRRSSRIKATTKEVQRHADDNEVSTDDRW